MSADDANWAPPPTEAESAVAAALTDAADAGTDAIKAAASEAIAQLGDDNPSASVLQEAAASGTAEDAKRAAESLTFRPRAEAPLAVGYPNPTRAHAIEVKTLPAYRMAITSMEGAKENRAFWNLFGHIQKEGIAMTAPVRMDYDEQNADEKSMAFLYREPTMGTLGSDQSLPVEVVEVPEQMVVSTGLRGRDKPERIQEAAARLKRWVESHGGYEIAGPLQVNGYNAPMTPASQRIVEVQFPVTKK